jgi:hypothetical protein
MIIIPVALCAAYLIMVSTCVCNRMTPKTNHLLRLFVVIIGGVGAWALCKAAIFGWGSTTADLLQGVIIVIMAIVLGLMPRLNTECKNKSAESQHIR